MSLKEQIIDDMRLALKSGDKEKLNTIRFLLAQIKNAEIDKGQELNEDELLGVIAREVKKITEAAEEFRQGGNSERAEKELKEAGILKAYLPEPLSEEEIEKLVDEAINKTGASSIKGMGVVMKELIPATRGRADGKLVSEIVRRKLGG